jgi:hypothetical protein
MDRNGVSNNAYLFDGAGDVIEVSTAPHSSIQRPDTPTAPASR